MAKPNQRRDLGKKSYETVTPISKINNKKKYSEPRVGVDYCFGLITDFGRCDSTYNIKFVGSDKSLLTY